MDIPMIHGYEERHGDHEDENDTATERCVTCRKREAIEALAGQCEECARGDAMLEQRSW